MGPALPSDFLRLPFAHRGLHGGGAVENSPAAFRAAAEAGYAIECDVQITRDGRAVVFHDYTLERLTSEAGPVRDRTADELGDLALRGGPDRIPTLEAVLELVGGRVPLLIEIKDQDGAMGPNVGPLELAVAQALAGYRGPHAAMSFNPHSAIALRTLLPDVPRGLVTSAYREEDWPELPAHVRDRLREIPDFDAAGAAFVSHEAKDLDRPRLGELRAAGAAILCWTIRSPEAEARARTRADNVTFEGYRPPHPGR